MHIPTMQEMLASVLSESEESLSKVASAPESETEQAATETSEGTTKIASADALALADQLDSVAGSMEKDSEAEGSKVEKILSKRAGVKSANAPQLETNLATMLKGKAPKKDKSKGSNVPLSPPMVGNKMQDNTHEEASSKGKTPDNLLKSAAERAQKIAAIKQRILSKLSASPAQLENNQGSTNAPSQPQEGDRSLIGSNEAAIRFTKGQAKATQKRLLKQVLQEPALSKSTDSKLHENLVNTGKAGVKISAVQREGIRQHLRKVASAVGTPEQAWLKEKIQKGQEKTAAAKGQRQAIQDRLRERSFFGAETAEVA